MVRAGKTNESGEIFLMQESGEIEGTHEGALETQPISRVYSEIEFSKIMENPIFFDKRKIPYLSPYSNFTTKFNLLYSITPKEFYFYLAQHFLFQQFLFAIRLHIRAFFKLSSKLIYYYLSYSLFDTQFHTSLTSQDKIKFL